METRRIVVLMHDLELELRRQQNQPAVTIPLHTVDVHAHAVDRSRGSSGKPYSKLGEAAVSRASKKAPPIKSGIASPKKKLERDGRSVRPQPPDEGSQSLHNKSAPLRKQTPRTWTKDISGFEQNDVIQARPGPTSQLPPDHSDYVLQKQQRPVSPTFQPLSFRTPARVQTPTRTSPRAASPSSQVAVSPTFIASPVDSAAPSLVQSARRSAANESSVSPTFNNSRDFDALSPQDSVVMLSNVKRRAGTPNLAAFEREVFDIDCRFEHSAVPIAAVAVQSYLFPSEHVRVEASSGTGAELLSAPGTSRFAQGLTQRAEQVADYSNYHRIDTYRLQSETSVHVSPAAAPAPSLNDLNDRTILNLQRHQLVERAPDLTQIFVPVTSAVAYVLCDLNAGPGALGKRFSDSINQLRREDEAVISPKKVGQGKCLKVILLEPPRMQVAALFNCNSLRDSECFRYMNTQSTVETVPFHDVFLPIALYYGDSTDIRQLPSRLSMNDFLHLAGMVSAWNSQSQDHVCCILMDVLHGARMSSLFLGMLSMFIGHCSDSVNAQSWLDANGEKCLLKFCF